MQPKNIKKIILFFAIFIFLFFGVNNTSASNSDNIYGWAWTENIGWINFNNVSITGDTGETIPGGGGSEYGVTINIDTGKITGYAWSENIGWIRFDPVFDSTTTTFPDGTIDNFAKVDLQNPINNQFLVSGWIRVCSVFTSGCSGVLNANRGGWDGWIYLHDITIDRDVDANGWHKFHQWVWGGE